MKTGDKINVSAPAGSFVLNTENENGKVFISGGVGQTPLVCMLESLINNNYNKHITWIHGCKEESVHAFKNTIATWAEQTPRLKNHIFYNKINQETKEEYLHEGWVDLNRLNQQIIETNTDYYICGPAMFIKMHYDFLTSKGIEKDHIYFEEFGPSTLHLS